MSFGSSVISHLCVESLQSVVNELSQVESEGEVDANPTAAAASAASTSGINPVSRDGYCFLSLTVLCRVFACLGRLKNHLIQFPPTQALKSIKES